MADEATGATATADEPKNVTLPDDEQAAAPTKPNDDDPKFGDEEEVPAKPDAAPKPTDGEDADEAPKDPEADDGEPKTPEAKENQKQFYERKLKEKDGEISKLTSQLNDYVDAGSDDSDKRLRRLEANDFITNVRNAQSEIDSGWGKAVSEFDVLDESKPDTFRKDLHDSLIMQYARDAVITEDVKDPDTGKVNKVVVGYRVPFYDFIAEKMALRNDGQQAGVREGQEAEAQMRASAEVPGSAKSKPSAKKDPFEVGFDSVE